MVVVSDTTTITNLIHINRLDILFELFGVILIPLAVYEELSVLEFQKKIIDENKHWIFVEEISDLEILENNIKNLDTGETHAIILAIRKNADFLIVDEIKARIVAVENNIKVVGLLGILIKAKQKGIVENVKIILNQLKTETGFWIKPDLYTKILELANEI